jgi:SAM-dependent methyltransferase
MNQQVSKWQSCLSILRCPQSGTELRIDGQNLVSARGHRYPIVDGKPVLVKSIQPFHITPPPANIISQNISEYTPALDAGPGWKLHLGSGNVPAKDVSVLSLDILPLPNVDIVVEAEALPFADNSVVYFEAGAVFEHLYDPFAAAEEFRRVLVYGGLFYIDTAFMQAYHGFPGHFLNMTSQAAETFLLDDFELIYAEIPDSGGPTYHLENSLRRFIDGQPPDQQARLLSASVTDFLSELTGRLRSQPQPEYIRRALAASVFVCGRKPNDYHARRNSVHEQFGLDAFKRLKRDYYASRMAVMERHYEVEYYSRHVSARTGSEAQPLSPVSTMLDAAKVVDPLDPSSWVVARETLRQAEADLKALRDQWVQRLLESEKIPISSNSHVRPTMARLRRMLSSLLRWIRSHG